MAKMPAKDELPVKDETAVEARSSPGTKPAVKHDPLKVFGIETAVPGEYLYVDDANEVDASGAFEHHVDAAGVHQVGHARKIRYHDANFEAVATDGDGCWIYRQM